MAQRSKKENYDALGAIFDFIFKEAEKKPEKRKPIKPSGISGENLLTDSLFAALEMPGAFVTGTMIDEFNGMLDIKLGGISFNDQGNISFSTGKMIDLLKDPGKYVQKAIDRAKADRKAGQIRFLGEVMDDFLTTAWAHKYGDLEAKEIALARASANEKDESYKVSRAIGQNIRTDPKGTMGNLNFMRDRSLELIGKRTFGPSWDSMSEQEKYDFTERLTNTKDLDKGVESGDVQQYLAQRYGRQEAQNFSRAVHSRNASDIVDLSDSNTYRSLENDYLRGKIGTLSKALPGSADEKKRKIYEKSLLMINLRNENQLNDLKKAYKETNDPAKKLELSNAISDAETARKLLGDRNNLLGGLGRLEGYLNSVNGVWGGLAGAPMLVPSILNGDFFDSGKNTVFCPTQEDTIGGVKIIKAKKATGRGATFKNAYNQMGESLYYVTPRSILRTFLFNGEGFAFLMSKQIESLQNIGGLSQEELFKGFGDVKGMDQFVQTTLAKMRASGVSAKDLARIESVLNKSKTLRKLTGLFSIPSQIKGTIEGLVKERIKKFRAGFAKMLLKNPSIRKWMIKSGAQKLLGTWITSGGIKTLIRSLITSAAAAAGVVLTPLGSAVISVLTWIATDLIMKLAKIFLSLGALMALGVLGVGVLLFSGGSRAVKNYNKTTYSYRHAVPDTVKVCSAYGFKPVTPGPGPNPGPIIPPINGEECVLGSQGISCSQGYVDVDGWSHQYMKDLMPVDLTNVEYIYAPQFCTTGDCSIKEVRAINCSDGSNAGGIVVLSASDGTNTYTFKLLHVQPLAGVGEKLTGGQPVAAVQFDLESGYCWTGPHLHLETRLNGQVVDPLALLKAFNCNVPDETGCSDP